LTPRCANDAEGQRRHRPYPLGDAWPAERDERPPARFGRVAIVHNGIIENFRELREAMEARGRKFETETDSETIAHLIDEGLSKGLKPKEAFKATLDQLRGAFAIAAIIEGEDNLILGGRRGSPLVIGVGDKEMFLGSDALAVGPFTQRVIYLEEGDWCTLTRTSFEIFDAAGKHVERAETHVPAAGAAAEKGNYRHFMQKEIYEQPDFVGRTVSAYIDAYDLKAVLPTRPGKKTLDFTQFDRIQIVACGTAYYAGFVAKYWFEQLAGIVADVDVASEFRYREPVLGPTHAGHHGDPVRRDGRHQGGDGILQGQGRDDGGCRQRADLLHRARVRCDPADVGGRRDRRSIHQGVHGAALRAACDGRCGRAPARIPVA
jgi:glucosamine 6-phosphate synthetase-like amidotransferase/phosphosugar isomerase protein